MCHIFKSIVNTVSDVVENAVHNPIATLADVAAVVTGQPEIAAIGNAVNTKVKGGSISQSLLSGATAYATSAIGNEVGSYASTSDLGRSVGLDSPVSSLLDDATTVGPKFVDTGLSDVIGSRAAGSLGGALANATVGNAVGGATSLVLGGAVKSGSDLDIGNQQVSVAATNVGTGVTSVTSAPTVGDAAPSGDDVARAAAEASGRNASVLSDQTDDGTVNGNPNILRRKSLLSD